MLIVQLAPLMISRLLQQRSQLDTGQPTLAQRLMSVHRGMCYSSLQVQQCTEPTQPGDWQVQQVHLQQGSSMRCARHTSSRIHQVAASLHRHPAGL